MGENKPDKPNKKDDARLGDGGVYLVVCDDGDDFSIALRYAAYLAKSNRGHLALLYVTNADDFVYWGNVEERMRKEMREEAEKAAWSVAKRVSDINGMIPSLYLEEGDPKDIIVDVINRDLTIKRLILGGKTDSSDPGPLVSYFTGKGLSKLRVPLVLVPEHVDLESLEALSE